MTNKQVIWFAVISLVLLAGFFLVAILLSLNLNYTQPLQQEQMQLDNIQRQDPDLLITPAAVLYQSLINESDPVRGNPQAKLIILEFGDFECAYCAQMYEDLLNILLAYQGQVKLVWKDFPNPSHLQARTAALAARCAQEQGRFWEYHDFLFINQDSLSRELYNQIALELDLDLAQFNKCLDNQEKIELVGQGLVDGQKLEVDATPYLFIGNRQFDYALSEDELKQVIQRELGN